MGLWQKITLAYHEAKTKVTTYVALASATFAELAAKAEDILNSMPQLASFLPKTAIVASALTHAAAGLGFLAVWTRIRRMLKTPAAS